MAVSNFCSRFDASTHGNRFDSRAAVGEAGAVRTDTPAIWDERETLTTMLDYVRATVHAKCEGLTEAGARAAPLPGSPLISITGLVSHLRWAEYFWFQVIYLGEENQGPWTEDDADAEMRVGEDTGLPDLLDRYESQSQDYRQLVERTDLEQFSAAIPSSGERVNLRWVLLHLIEETARHNGHIDLLREMADGVRGT